MKKVLIVFLYLVCLVAGQLYGQTQPLNPALETISPPAPNAYAIAKFGNVPVGPSTGIPQIDVPVYNYENKSLGLNLAVALAYHAGGVRVDEMPSSVGIGWALNAGGVVTRTVRGIYDEMNGIGFINSPALPIDEEAGNTGADPANRPFNKMYDLGMDSQNDIFNFNFCGRSGKFVYGKNSNLLMLDQQRLKVEREISQVPGSTSAYPMISKFIIWDESGFRYIFDAEELTHDQSIGTAAALYTSSWYLTKILTPSGKDSIVLDYDDTEFSYYAGKSVSEVLKLPDQSGLEIPPRGLSTSIASRSISGKRLKYITFPNGVQLSFTYSTTERTDQPYGDFLLKKINISSGSATRGFKLMHDYSLNRPTLTNVIPFTGTAETPEPGYAFTYDIPLPARLSNEQDHWGFYNTNSSQQLIPTEAVAVGSGGNYGSYHVYGGGNRHTDPQRSKAGSLKRIKYPTGGYTDFEMEANRAVDPRLDTRTTATTVEYFKWVGTTVYCTSSGSNTTTFDFHGDPNTATEIEVQVPSTSYTCNNVGGCRVVLEIRNPSGVLIDVHSFEAPTSSHQPVHTFTLNNLVQGTYSITSFTQGITSSYFVYVSFRWKEVRVNDPIIHTHELGDLQLYVGGLRVKKISDYVDGSATPVTVQEFEYLLKDGETSSGTLGMYPVYSNTLYFDKRSPPATLHVPELYTTSSPNFIVRTSSTVFSMEYSNGSPVAYKRVVKKLTANNQNMGWTESYFKSFDQAPVIINKPFPYGPPEYKSWVNGLPDSILTYNSAGVLQRKEVNAYQFHDDNYHQNPAVLESFRSVSISPVKYLFGYNSMEGTTVPYWTFPVYFKSVSFYPAAGRAELVGKDIYEYDAAGKLLRTQTEYQYDSDYYYLKSSITLNSRNESIRQNYFYPNDMVTAGRDPGNIYQQMINRHIIGPVVESVTFKNNIQQVLTRKNFFNPHPDVFVPQDVVSKIKTLPEEARVLFNKYSANGCLLEQQMAANVKETYLWGYHSQYPVAKVVGSDYNSALQHVSQSILANPANDQALRVELNKLRTNLPGAQVTTFTYNPLTGVTSETDPAGRTIYYEYDDFGRLKLVKDQSNRILRQFDYRYQSAINQ